MWETWLPCPCRTIHLKDLCSCPELVALIPAVEEVNGLAHVVPGILDLKTVPTEWLVGWPEPMSPHSEGLSSLEGWVGAACLTPPPQLLASCPGWVHAHGTD